MSAHLAGLGLDVIGIDLSPGMIAVARRRHPTVRFDVGSMAELDIDDGTLAGAVAWYSVIHTPEVRQPILYSEFARVLRPGGWLLLGFQLGDDVVHLTRGYGHEIELHTRRQDLDRVLARLRAAGFTPVAEVRRHPRPPERSPQGFVLASRE